MKVILTVDNLRFESAHNLYNYDGKCANLHGHSYKLSVSVEGEVNDDGFVMDFGNLKKICKETIVDLCDHQYINNIMDGNPTAENMVIWFSRILKGVFKKYKGVSLKAVKLWETENNCAEIRF